MKINILVLLILISSKCIFPQHFSDDHLLKKYKIELDILNKIDLENSFGFSEGKVSEIFSLEFNKRSLKTKTSNYRYFVSISYGWSFKNNVDLVVENYKGVIIDKENDDLILATFQCGKAKELQKVIEITVQKLIHSIQNTIINDKEKFIDINDHFKRMEMNLWDSSRPDAHGPVSVYGDHCHEKGGLMFSYRFMSMNMSGNLNGNDVIANDQIFNQYNSLGESMSMRMHMIGAMYGIANNISLMVMLGHTSKSMNMLTKKNVVFQTKSSGINDVKITALYRFLNKSKYKIHANIGLSIPSGRINFRDDTPSTDNMKLPYVMQIGSGTWNVILGATSHFQFNKFSLGLQPIYLAHTGKNSQNYRLGDNLNLNYWVAYKILDWMSISFNLQNKFSYNIMGNDSELMSIMAPAANNYNYGSKISNGSTGINFVVPSGFFDGLRISIEYFIPLHQNYDGIQMGMDNNLYIGLQFSPGGNNHH